MKSFAKLGIGIFFIFTVNAWSLEIPLSGTQGNETGGGRIGFIDMERIFQTYPQTKDAKEDYMKKRDKMREDLTAKERNLEEVKQKLAVLEATILGLKNTGNESTSNSTAPANGEAVQSNPENITQMKKDLETLQAEYETARQTAEDDLAAFEKKQTQIILGKIYEALQELAEDEQVTLVVDKSSILYGAADIDLTEKLQKRVRGY